MNRKDAAFFEAFNAHANATVEAARLLVEMTVKLKCEEAAGVYCLRPSSASKAGGGGAGASSDLNALAMAIKAKESEGDRITHDTMKRLHENWITPLDRYDIHELMSRLDDVLDDVEAAADRIVLFEVEAIVIEGQKLAETVFRECQAMAKALSLLNNMKNATEILRLCVEVNRLENEADQLYRTAIAGLFRPGNDALAAMKWRDIFESLESASDRCEDVANVIEGVVVEYA